jgi:hypothetical protein
MSKTASKPSSVPLAQARAKAASEKMTNLTKMYFALEVYGLNFPQAVLFK